MGSKVDLNHSVVSMAVCLQDFFKGLTDMGVMGGFSMQLQAPTKAAFEDLQLRNLLENFICDLQNLVWKLQVHSEDIIKTENNEVLGMESTDCNAIETIICHNNENNDDARTVVLSEKLNEDTEQDFIIIHPGEERLYSDVMQDGSVIDHENVKHVIVQMSDNYEDNDGVIVMEDESTHEEQTSITINTHNNKMIISSNENEESQYEEEQCLETENQNVVILPDSNNTDFLNLITSSTEEIVDTRKAPSNKKHKNVEDRKLNVCPSCPKTFHTDLDLDKHITRMHQVDIICDYCDQEFPYVVLLKQHCEQVHGVSNCFGCGTCGRRMTTKIAYLRHLKTHSGVKDATCDICGKCFSRRDYLHRHSRVHNGERPYKCGICGKAFSNRSNLNVHALIHNGTKSYSCDACGTSFLRLDKLKEHMLRHLKIKKYKCNLCSKAYAEYRDLKKHVDIVHKKESVEIKTI